MFGAEGPFSSCGCLYDVRPQGFPATVHMLQRGECPSLRLLDVVGGPPMQALRDHYGRFHDARTLKPNPYSPNLLNTKVLNAP